MRLLCDVCGEKVGPGVEVGYDLTLAALDGTLLDRARICRACLLHHGIVLSLLTPGDPVEGRDK